MCSIEILSQFVADVANAPVGPQPRSWDMKIPTLLVSSLAVAAVTFFQADADACGTDKGRAGMVVFDHLHKVAEKENPKAPTLTIESSDITVKGHDAVAHVKFTMNGTKWDDTFVLGPADDYPYFAITKETKKRA